jgi:hypothetical protein
MSQTGHGLAWDTLDSETRKLAMEKTASGARMSLHPDLLWLDLALALLHQRHLLRQRRGEQIAGHRRFRLVRAWALLHHCGAASHRQPPLNQCNLLFLRVFLSGIGLAI